MIYEAEGAIVPGLGDRSGKRFYSASKGEEHKDRRGGARKRDFQKDVDAVRKAWWHKDALPELTTLVQESILRAVDEDVEQEDEQDDGYAVVMNDGEEMED